MTHEQLSKLIVLSCKKAIKEEMAKLKQEILTELRRSSSGNVNPLKEQHVKFRQQFQVQKPKPSRYSSNPTINELLKGTEPLKDQTEFYEETFGDLNVPTTEGGLPIQNVQSHVLEAMNRDYSHLVQKQTQQKTGLRNKFESIVNETNGFDNSFDNYEEDNSFLDQLG